MDAPPPDSHHVEFDALMEIARRLEVWASEVGKPASHILRSVATNLRRCATRLMVVGTDLVISQILAEEDAHRQEILARVEALPVWTVPLYLERVALLAEGADIRRRVKGLVGIDPNG